MKKILFITLFFICFNSFATDVSGTYDSSVTWTLAGSPYNFTGSVTIKGATLM